MLLQALGRTGVWGVSGSTLCCLALTWLPEAPAGLTFLAGDAHTPPRAMDCVGTELLEIFAKHVSMQALHVMH